MEFTYERQSRVSSLETYEWDNVWWEKADDITCPRGLYIGDSISCGIRGPLNRALGDQIHIDGFGTSKAIDNPYLKDAISVFGKQSRNKKVVMFNSGLHGWHLDSQQYGRCYLEMVAFLVREFPEAVLVLLTTTPTEEENRRLLILERNEKAREAAQKFGLPIIDLYAIAKGLEHRDGVHFTEASNHVIAVELAARLKSILGI